LPSSTVDVNIATSVAMDICIRVSYQTKMLRSVSKVRQGAV
jgi:hypothetical protein